MNFELPLVEEKVKPHQVTALHLIVGFALCGISGVCFLLGAYLQFWSKTIFHTAAIPGGFFLLAGLLILSVAFFRNRWLQRTTVNFRFRIVELVLILMPALYVANLRWWLPAGILGVLVLAICFGIYWERQKNITLTVEVAKEGIKLPVIARKRNIHWQDVEKVLLRYGTLTIDCVDNSLYQWNISANSVNKEQFELFCLEQIEEGKTKRDKNDW